MQVIHTLRVESFYERDLRLCKGIHILGTKDVGTCNC